MKQISWILCAFLYSTTLFAQIEPRQIDDSFLKKLHVKTSSTSYTDTEGKEHLIMRKQYSPEGDLTQKYLLSLWEAVSYSNTTDYYYNEKGLLVESNTSQKILNLNDRDEEFINSFGAKPLNEKILYTYNEEGLVSQKETFSYSTEELSASAKPTQVVLYTYENGLLKIERSISPEPGIFNHNQTTTYVYDEKNNIVQKQVTYGKNMDMTRTTQFLYDSQNRIVEEKVDDSGIPRNNGHFKYLYDSLGHMTQKLVFEVEEKDYVEIAKYAYDDHGQQISGLREIELSYYENGLIQSEKWKDEITDEAFVFTTLYDFH